jgi:hypothetical protein
VGSGFKRVNMAQILHIHECKWKKIPVERISLMGVGGGEFKYDIFDIL